MANGQKPIAEISAVVSGPLEISHGGRSDFTAKRLKNSAQGGAKRNPGYQREIEDRSEGAEEIDRIGTSTDLVYLLPLEEDV
jgi:hypothetical protein